MPNSLSKKINTLLIILSKKVLEVSYFWSFKYFLFLFKNIDNYILPMTSPRNRTKQTIYAEKSAASAKPSGHNNNNKKKKINNLLGKIQLRPLEKIGLSLMALAFLYWVFFSGKKEPEVRPIEQISAPEVLEEKASNLRPLYITIDSLKLRAQPKLDSNFIRYLAFDETVYDMGEQTKNVQTIRYSAEEIRTEPWVKIRTESGEIGWVFGAGVNFYRKKRRIGVIDSTSTNTNTSVTEPSATTATTPAATTTTNTAPATTPAATTTLAPSTAPATTPANTTTAPR